LRPIDHAIRDPLTRSDYLCHSFIQLYPSYPARFLFTITQLASEHPLSFAMADQATQKGEVTVPVVDAQEAPATEIKSTEPAADETAPKADGETSEDAKPNDGMFLKLKQFAHRALSSIPAIFASCHFAWRSATANGALCPVSNSR
jgi:hypothetical protein